MAGSNIAAGTGRAFRRIAASRFFLAAFVPVMVFAIALWATVPTLAPAVGNWDTAEFQTVGPVLGTAHPTGYPAYVILGWIASILFQPFGNPAFTMNLLQAFLTALAAAGTAALVAVLTGRRFVAFAVGLAMLVMPTVQNTTVALPVAGGLSTTPVFMRLATHADPHMFHAALVAIIFALLAMWDRRIHELEPGERRRADKWLVAAAFAYAVAVANHSLALLLPPGIGLFVLLVDWRVILRGRTLLACVAALVGPLVVLFAELPIRAAMGAPLVYGHPDTLGGFTYVILAEQFRGSLVDPFGSLALKAGDIVDLMAGWLGPLGPLAILGVLTSFARRPRFLVLSGLTFLITCFFSVSYANADIERYFLVPILIAFTWIGLAAADLIEAVAFVVALAADRFAPEPADDSETATYPSAASAASTPAIEAAAAPAADLAVDGGPASPHEPAENAGRRRSDRFGLALIVGELVVALALVLPVPGAIPTRQESPFYPGGVSEAGDRQDEEWMTYMLTPADQGGLPVDSVIVSWWSVSTTLWYGQRVLHLRPDIYIVDDRTRLDDNLGSVQDVFNKFLDKRPVFVIRTPGGDDGMDVLSTQYDMRTYSIADGAVTISQVVGRKGNK